MLKLRRFTTRSNSWMRNGRDRSSDDETMNLMMCLNHERWNDVTTSDSQYALEEMIRVVGYQVRLGGELPQESEKVMLVEIARFKFSHSIVEQIGGDLATSNARGERRQIVNGPWRRPVGRNRRLCSRVVLDRESEESIDGSP